MPFKSGWLDYATQSHCDHFDTRPQAHDISLLVIHNISLPPGQFGSSYVQAFFGGELNPNEHEFFKQIYQIKVSAHFYIRRTGQVIQFVPIQARAWHAGVSSFQGRTRCNDFSIGIEMEGTDNVPYTDAQYHALSKTTKDLMIELPNITLGRIVGHNDIAPGRKTDPGVAFDWTRFRRNLRLVE